MSLTLYLATQDESSPLEVRQSAGLLLKNNLRNAYAAAPPEFKLYIRNQMLPCLASATKVLRHTAGTIVSVIVGVAGLAAWPELVSALPLQTPLPPACLPACLPACKATSE